MMLPKKVIKEFDLLLDGAYYEKSPNPDMLYIWERSEVYLSGTEKALENQLVKINQEIDEFGVPVKYPKDVTPGQKEAIDIHNQRFDNKVILEEARDKMQEHLDKLSVV